MHVQKLTNHSYITWMNTAFVLSLITHAHTHMLVLRNQCSRRVSRRRVKLSTIGSAYFFVAPLWQWVIARRPFPTCSMRRANAVRSYGEGERGALPRPGANRKYIREEGKGGSHKTFHVSPSTSHAWLTWYNVEPMTSLGHTSLHILFVIVLTSQWLDWLHWSCMRSRHVSVHFRFSPSTPDHWRSLSKAHHHWFIGVLA